MSIQSLTQPLLQIDLKLTDKPQGIVYVLGPNPKAKSQSEYKSIIESHSQDFQTQKLLESEKKQVHFVGRSGAVWVLKNVQIEKGQQYGMMDESEYGWYREQAGTVLSACKNLQIENLQFYFSGVKNPDVVRACVVGMELASYNFFQVYSGKKTTLPKVSFKVDGIKISADQIQRFQLEAMSMQLARHLVNLPPNEVNPLFVESVVRELKFPNTKVTVWDEKKLAAENMNLLMAVGAGSRTPPRLIHLRYRPKKPTSKKPIAFVGKGITFDTGGLDIKPSSAMRLMRKDMAGSASVMALAYWVANSGYSRPCDFYLPLAENAVDANAMRPSDLYKSRAGFVVEIDNTDAEGRLVLADALDVAVTQTGKDEPEFVIDIATLTGAIKVALGLDVAGVFSNNDQLGDQIVKAGQAAGEPGWRMPLIPKLFSTLNSNFADFRNSGDGMGGAITAALFLEKFVKNKKWVHMDVYCWTDKATGSLAHAGASGQPIQTLIQWLKTVG